MISPDIMLLGTTKIVCVNFDEMCTERGFNTSDAAIHVLIILGLENCRFSRFDAGNKRLFLKRTRTLYQIQEDKLNKRRPYFTMQEISDALESFIIPE
jgi:hypothetical protein